MGRWQKSSNLLSTDNLCERQVPSEDLHCCIMLIMHIDKLQQKYRVQHTPPEWYCPPNPFSRTCSGRWKKHSKQNLPNSRYADCNRNALYILQSEPRYISLSQEPAPRLFEEGEDWIDAPNAQRTVIARASLALRETCGSAYFLQSGQRRITEPKSLDTQTQSSHTATSWMQGTHTPSTPFKALTACQPPLSSIMISCDIFHKLIRNWLAFPVNDIHDLAKGTSVSSSAGSNADGYTAIFPQYSPSFITKTCPLVNAAIPVTSFISAGSVRVCIMVSLVVFTR